MRPEKDVLLSDSKAQDLSSTLKIININNYYKAYKEACEELMEHPEYLNKSTPDKKFIIIKTDSKGNTTSGVTNC